MPGRMIGLGIDRAITAQNFMRDKRANINKTATFPLRLCRDGVKLLFSRKQGG